jgi:REP element-mobilizing transposase RayT
MAPMMPIFMSQSFGELVSGLYHLGLGGVVGWKVEGCRLKSADMKFDPQKHRRRSIRLKDYDYSQAGAYYVTINVQNRECLFGEIVNYEMVLNDAGKMIEAQWLALLERFPNIELDAYQVMPNHVHGIIVLVEPVGATLVVARNMDTKDVHGNEAGIKPAPTLGKIVGAFKSITTHEYIHGVETKNWRQFYKRLWQRNYYEHIVRDEADLNRIRDYIQSNPANWDEDEENPNRQS